MKLLKRTLFFVLSLMLLNSCDSETPEKATNYHKSIIDEVNTLTIDKEAKLIGALENYQPDSMQIYLSELEKQVNEIDASFSQIQDFYGDKSLLKQGKIVISKYKMALPIYKKLVQNELLSQDEYTDENAKLYTKLMDDIDVILNEDITKITKASVQFAKVHKVKLLPVSEILKK